MKNACPRRKQQSILLSDRIVLFFFFAAGAAIAFFWFGTLPEIAKPRLFLGMLMAAILLFSTSVAGGVLLPLCTLCCGAFVEQRTLLSVSALPVGLLNSPRVLLSGVLLVPVFFLASFHGMAVSAAIQTAAISGSPTARETCRQELLLVILFAVLSLTVAFYFY